MKTTEGIADPRRSAALVLLAALVVFLAAPGARAGGHCISISRDPEDVLACVERAFNERDLEACAWILAPDFRWYDADSSVLHTRKTALETARKLFDPETTVSLSLRFDDGYRVVRGRMRDLWIIENVGWTESIEFAGDRYGGPVVREVRGARIHVRITAHKRPRLRIYSVRME